MRLLRIVRLGALRRRRVIVAVLDLVLLGIYLSFRRRGLRERLSRALPEVALLEAVGVRQSSFCYQSFHLLDTHRFDLVGRVHAGSARSVLRSRHKRLKVPDAGFQILGRIARLSRCKASRAGKE
jgi:hypothetical protein